MNKEALLFGVCAGPRQECEERNDIFIYQHRSNSREEMPDVISIHPDQVDLLVQWLQEAKTEALKDE